MKPLFVFLIFACYSFAQNSENNFITYSNYANEAEYYFHEGAYDTAAIYFAEAFKFSDEQHPTHQKLYSYSLLQLNQRKKAIKLLEKIWGHMNVDTVWFHDLTSKEKLAISNSREKIRKQHKSIDFHRNFIDSIMSKDQLQRNLFIGFMDSLSFLEPYPKYFIDSIRPIKWKSVNHQDSCNKEALIEFTRKFGFPAGKNAGWDQTAATFLLHMPADFYVENYELLISEVIKGNLEPWMLARGIDRMYTVEIGKEKVNPYNRYWSKSIIDPFLMFQNCISLGVSPYYDYNWSTKPKKTINFEYYKKNKQYYNATIMYTHNNTYTPLLKSRFE